VIHATGLPTILSPTTCGCSVSPRRASCGWTGPRRHPSAGSTPSGNSRLRLQLAGSPHRTGRIEFLIVRTGRSPPAPPHPALRRRRCSRFQVTLTWRGLPPLRSIALSGALAGGNAPGKQDALFSTLKGSHNPCAGGGIFVYYLADSTLSGSGSVRGLLPGALPPAIKSPPPRGSSPDKSNGFFRSLYSPEDSA
jgi:hypothetical protein